MSKYLDDLLKLPDEYHPKINLITGFYICPICNKEMKANYITKIKLRKRITKNNLGLPIANAIRHCISCYKKFKGHLDEYRI